MSRLLPWAACLVAAAVARDPGSVRAQPPPPGGARDPRPAFSPYLNLLRPGGSPVQNYYGLVRPEVQFRQSIQGLQGVVTANQQALAEARADASGLPATGHPVQFLNYGGYFLNGGPAPTSARPGGGPGMPRGAGAAAIPGFPGRRW
jgi:hypothetical protein